MDHRERAPAARGHRRGPRWVSVTRGAHRPVGDGDPWTADLDAWQLVIPPTASFTHLTGARLRGWWLPPLPDALPVFIGMDRDDSAPERPGLKVCRHPHVPAYEVVDGLRVATAAETILACARDLGLLDLVVLVDSALHLGHCTLAELAAVAALRRRGAPLLRTALTYTDGRAESAYEVLLRVFHVVCGIDVEPQHEVRDADGRFVARGDLWLRGTTTLHEYDGAHHLSRDQQRKDLDRARRLERARWSRRGYTAVEVLHRPVAILRDADASTGRPHEPDRVRDWYTLLRGSLFTPVGTRRLRGRLGLPLVADTSVWAGDT